jgi:outer membrane lipase/esterase
MKTPFRHLLAGAFAAIAVTALAQTRTFTSQYTFGDSLSDNGNAYLASGRTINTSPANFGGRWSNGPTFVEQLGNTLVPAASVSAVRGNLDFAFGGATAVPALSAVPFPALPTQIQMFQVQHAPIQSTDLFTVWMGANDILNTAGLPGTPTNPAAMDAAGFNAAAATAGAIQTLIAAGAKNILVLNMPDIGLTPAGLSSGAGAFLTRGSLAYNREFDTRLAAIASGAADVNITRIDAAALIAQMQRDFKLLGFANATSGLILPAAQGGGGDPAGYVFFDGIHPTARTHALLAGMVLEALNPEPVIGFAATEGTAALALESLAQRAIADRGAQLAMSTRPVGRADAFATVTYGDGDRKSEGWRPKTAFTAQVVTAGVDLHIANDVFVGGALDFGRASVTVSGGRGNYAVEDATGRLYSVWRGGPVSLMLDADYGSVLVKGIHRATSFGGLPTNGKTAGDHWGAGAKLAWTVETGPLMNFQPWLELRTERVKLDAYEEHDIASLSMAFDGQTAKSAAGAIGVDFNTATKLSGHDLRFDLRAAWHGELGSHTRTVSGKLANNFTHTTAIGVKDGDGDGVELGGAVTLFFAKNWSTSLGYAGDIRSGEKLGSRATLSVQTGF